MPETKKNEEIAKLENIKKNLKEQILDMVNFYALQFEPCEYCTCKKRKTGAEMQICQSCCFYYPSKFIFKEPV